MASKAERAESLPEVVKRPALIGEVVERPALTVEDRQNRMISLATDLAEQQLRDGTASSQVITHYLKLGTQQARLECAKLEYETELVKAKTKAIEATAKNAEMYERAMRAFQSYQGKDVVDADYQDV